MPHSTPWIGDWMRKGSKRQPVIDTRDKRLLLSRREAAEAKKVLQLLLGQLDAEIETDRAPAIDADFSPDILRDLAMKLYLQRRTRDAHFGRRFNGEHAWQVLLALYGRASREPLRTTQVLSFVSAGNGTVIRHLDMLEDAGLITKADDAHDKRLTMINISDHGVSVLEAYLRELLAQRLTY